ncbi:MAG: ubiquinol-cytochrome c reductase iron-sulfur subunit [Ostreibacterium sp.]
MTVSKNVNRARRRIIVGASTAVGGVAVVGIMVPYLGAWMPSEKAKSIGAPIEMEISKLPEGAQQRAVWRGKAIYVIRMTEAMAKTLDEIADKGWLRDPDSKESDLPVEMSEKHTRELRPGIVVLIGVCTHLGCAPLLEGAEKGQTHIPGWLGGFFCPCHGSKYDYTGRVFKDVPAPLNLAIPPYYFKSDSLIVIGEMQPEKA